MADIPEQLRQRAEGYARLFMGGRDYTARDEILDKEAADEIERLRAVVRAFMKAKASVGGNSYDGVDQHTRDLLEQADVQARIALGVVGDAERSWRTNNQHDSGSV